MLLCQTSENGDKFLAAVYRYQNHPSIETIPKNYNFSFCFKTVSFTDIEKEMESLNTNKAFHSYDTPNKNFKTKRRYYFSVNFQVKRHHSST